MVEVLFLGTAGARYVVAKQFRASGGLILRQEKGCLLIDPGPGTLVQLAKQKISPEKIKSIILTHKHLDHSADLNIIVDALTEGGFKKRGRLFIPEEALTEGILLSYLKPYLQEIILLQEKNFYQTELLDFWTTCKLKHNAETYGLIFLLPQEKRLGLISDTAYFEGLKEEFSNCHYLIINLVRFEPKKEVLHLSVEEVKNLLYHIRPELTILTHFGMTMLRANPFQVAKKLSEELDLKVLAAYDGMKISLT